MNKGTCFNVEHTRTRSITGTPVHTITLHYLTPLDTGLAPNYVNVEQHANFSYVDPETREQITFKTKWFVDNLEKATMVEQMAPSLLSFWRTIMTIMRADRVDLEFDEDILGRKIGGTDEAG